MNVNEKADLVKGRIALIEECLSAFSSNESLENLKQNYASLFTLNFRLNMELYGYYIHLGSTAFSISSLVSKIMERFPFSMKVKAGFVTITEKEVKRLRARPKVAKVRLRKVISSDNRVKETDLKQFVYQSKYTFQDLLSAKSEAVDLVPEMVPSFKSFKTLCELNNIQTEKLLNKIETLKREQLTDSKESNVAVAIAARNLYKQVHEFNEACIRALNLSETILDEFGMRLRDLE